MNARVWILGLSLFVVSCDELPPLKVPGPTTARPPATTTLSSAKGSAAALVSQRNEASRVVSIRLVFASGSSDDPKGKEGVTSLAADMIAASGTTKLTYAEMTKQLYPFAAQISSHTDKDTTVFETEVAAASLAEFYPLFRDVILTPRMDDEAFGRLKAQALSAVTDDLRSSNDEALGKEALQTFLYEGHPYGHPSVGTETGLGGITLSDVQAQSSSAFCRDRVTVGVAGGFPEGFDKTLADDIAKLPACGAARSALPAPKKASKIKVVIIDKPTAESTAISLGFPTDVTRAEADYPSLFFFTTYLGLHRQSAGVLYHELRETRGFNYGDYAYAEHFEQDGWERYPQANIARRQQYVSIWLRPIKPVNALFALRGALYLTAKQLSEGISDAEISRFRTFVSRYFALEQQTETRRLGYAIDDLAYGLKEPWLERMRSSWQSLTSAKLKEAVDRRFPGGFVVVIVSKDGAALKKVLVKGGPTPPSYDAPKPAPVTEADKIIEKLPLGLDDGDVTVVPVASMFR